MPVGHFTAQRLGNSPAFKKQNAGELLEAVDEARDRPSVEVLNPTADGVVDG